MYLIIGSFDEINRDAAMIVIKRLQLENFKLRILSFLMTLRRKSGSKFSSTKLIFNSKTELQLQVQKNNS